MLKLRYITLIVLVCGFGLFPLFAHATFTQVANFPQSKYGHGSALLQDGTVLTCGGWLSGAMTSSCHIYDPDADSFTTVSAMPTPRQRFAMETLTDGTVLMCGGFIDGSHNMTDRCDIYDAATDSFTQIADLPEEKSVSNATLLDDGTVLICGGTLNNSTPVLTDRCDIYDPLADSFTQVANYPVSDRTMSASKLQNGDVLFCGGATNPANVCRTYDPSSDAFTTVTNLPQYKGQQRTVTFSGGTVLMCGGRIDDTSTATNRCDIYDPYLDSFTQVTNLPQSKWMPSMEALSGGRALVCGGYGGGSYSNRCDIYSPILTITGPDAGDVNTSHDFTFDSPSHPGTEGDGYVLAIDWNGDSSVDEYYPSLGDCTTNCTYDTSYSWSTAGDKRIGLRAEDSEDESTHWTYHIITIANPAPVALVTASDETFREGDSAVDITWSSSDATSCTGTNFSTGGATSGTVEVTPTATTTYAVSCTDGSESDDDSVTVTYTPNQAPAAPTLSGPLSGYTGFSYTYTGNSVDPEGDQVKIGIDWDNDDTVDAWHDSFGASGVDQETSYAFTSPGTYTIQAQAEDARGAFSGWSDPFVIVIADSCTDCDPITGHGWSDTVGWISMSCLNTGTCGTSAYGFEIEQDGTISGYGWSSNVGWVSAQSSDITGCPYGTCTARIDTGTGALLGWMKVLSASGDWDGWISLSCENNGWCSTSSYAPTLDYDTGQFSNYAWGGGHTIGWIDFQYAYTAFEPLEEGYTCLDGDTLRHIDSDLNVTDTVCPYAADGYGCAEVDGVGACLIPPYPAPSGGDAENDLLVQPRLVRSGGTTSVSWDIEDATSCSVSGDNGDLWSGVSGAYTSSPITEKTKFTLYCSSGIDGFDYTKFVTVDVVPAWQEF